MLVAFIAWALLRSAHAGADATDIPITLYTDNACDDPSVTATNITLNIGVCVVTPGLGSFDLQPFPCDSGSVANYVFSDTACGQTAGFSYYRGGNDGHCYAAYSGDMAAIMLSCNQDTPGQPSSTTTITVGPVATGASSTSTPGSSSPTSSSGSGGGSSSSSGTGTDSSSTSSTASGWNSLDLGSRIAIIVSLAVGIPPILIGLIALEQKRKKDREKKREEYERIHGTPMNNLPSSYQNGWSTPSPMQGPVPPRPAYTTAQLAHNWAGYNYMTSGGGGGGA